MELKLPKSKYYLLEFGATWCEPCKVLAKELEQLNIKVVQVDIRSNKYEDFLERFKLDDIDSIPELFLVKDGKINKRIKSRKAHDIKREIPFAFE